MPRRKPTPRARPAATPSRLARALGVVGWDHLDPVLLAALATGSPLLLVGAHGTAKSLLVERVAEALELELRHYNAALLNYDDLVGIPLPDEEGGLRFARTPGSLWDAEVIFFDEIARCRPDLQNKLFPIVHEHRVLGLPLPRLRHCWAAMNPPPAEGDLDEPGGRGVYLGCEPLDPALADRFPFVVRVPAWGELEREQRAAVVLGHSERRGAGWLPELVVRCSEQLPAVEAGLEETGSAYVLAVADRLGGKGLELSPRRARMLYRGLAAVHAARLTLGHDPCTLEQSAWLTLSNGLPQGAEGEPPPVPTLLAAHRSAWEAAAAEPGSPWRRVLEEPDPLRRVRLGEELGLPDAELSRLVTRALSEQRDDADRVAAGAVMFLAFERRRDLSPAAWETLALVAGRVLSPQWRTAVAAPGADLERWREVNAHVARLGGDRLATLERNYLLAGFPELWRGSDWRKAAGRLGEVARLFGVGKGGAP
jgi:MoxR-like ATPase